MQMAEPLFLLTGAVLWQSSLLLQGISLFIYINIYIYIYIYYIYIYCMIYIYDAKLIGKGISSSSKSRNWNKDGNWTGNRRRSNQRIDGQRQERLEPRSLTTHSIYSKPPIRLPAPGAPRMVPRPRQANDTSRRSPPQSRPRHIQMMISMIVPRNNFTEHEHDFVLLASSFDLHWKAVYQSRLERPSWASLT